VIPPVRSGEFGWRAALLGIAERLEQPVTVNPCGMARLLFLLTDGAGPLYNDRAERSLGGAIWEIVDGLEPCPPHDWDSPKVMKLDPEQVAWTCRRCGAIATTDDSAVRPA
jgi:hypothetical protein